MSATKHEIRRGAYYDSVVLMQLQRGLLGLHGVIDAGAVMATPANRELLAANNLLPDSVSANPDDMLIVVKADEEKSAVDAISKVDELLTRRKSSNVSEDFRPRSLSGALKQLPESGWVLISVPGRYAANVARDALDLDQHVFLYSDNVSLEDEIALKQTAREKGLLVMGPDCGTVIINGIGLGFANRVRRGPIGLVGASGTGTQAVTTHIHELGGGITHAIGTGGRDLKSEVGGITALQALNILANDPETKAIALVSKPPSHQVVTQLLAAVQATGKPIVVDFIGYPPPARRMGNLHFATSLIETAEIAMQLANQKSESNRYSPLAKPYLRGLFSGGTLAYETLLGLQGVLSPIYSNGPITENQTLKNPLRSEAHSIIDLGDEFFMVGRLHPMIDNDLRIRRMKQEAEDSEVGLLLLDLVLGEGSHINPASELAPVIKEIKAQRRELDVAAIVIGTDSDPQNMESQVEQLKAAGTIIFHNVRDAVEYISGRMSHYTPGSHPSVALDRLTQPLAAINVGLESFYESLKAQGAQAVHVEWRPPASGDEKLTSILARMKK